ncbi:hypothetical protein GN958_ATG21813 [Phytophthora infestans]|uniref:M96 mating-specific protein family n=1 Tax=Phytophthora infestans TaxID=4787 RepID=A0A8S9TMR9_PHYIN|nr:hypothetical protein GN958_ATG21813 [Phytophthora infestans]
MAFKQQMDMTNSALAEFLFECSPSTPDSIHMAPSRDLIIEPDIFSLPWSNSTSQMCQTSPIRSGNAGPTARRAQPWVGNESTEQRYEIRIAQAAIRQKRYHLKTKEERKMLKRQVTELSAVLGKLQGSQARTYAIIARNPALAAWRATAIHQKARRIESETKQVQLRAFVARQSMQIRSMNGLLQQCRVHDPVALLELHSSSMAMLFKTLMQELDPLHAMTNKITAGVDFKLSSLPMQFAMSRHWNRDMTFLESSHATIVPFGFDDTCHALSDALLTNPRGQICYDGIMDPENTRAFKYHLDFSQELGDSAALVKHTVMRRYVEPDRVVFVSRTLAEGQQDFKGMYTNETTWHVLRRSTDDSAMVLETYTRLMLVGFSLTSQTDARGDEFMKVLARADEDEVSNIMVMFERMLLDETRRICL